MADNYLEKQYELYQARKAEWEKKKKFGKRKPIRKPADGKAAQTPAGDGLQPETRPNHE